MTVTPVLQTFEGMWLENDCTYSQSGGMASAGAAVMFHDGYAYFGICGDTGDQILANASGAGGEPAQFELTTDSLIIYTPSGDPMTYRREGTTWYAGSSTFTPAPGHDGGQLIDKP